MKFGDVLGFGILIAVTSVSVSSVALAQTISKSPTQVASSAEMSRFEGVVKAEAHVQVAQAGIAKTNTSNWS